MISKDALIGLEGLPQHIRRKLDHPWHFLGEFEGINSRMQCYCRKCHEGRLRHAMDDKPLDIRYRDTIVELDSYHFVTENNRKEMFYFGVCEECGAVHWATMKEVA